jgi:isopenicillin N synthase-like dioxygenase
MASLPVIDFSVWIDSKSTAEQKLKVALKIDQACRDTGFFYLTNHGIPSKLIGLMLEKGRDFMSKATQEEKNSLAIKPAGVEDGDDARGYQKNYGTKRGSHEVGLSERKIGSNHTEQSLCAGN